jgi:hypothetical protein
VVAAAVVAAAVAVAAAAATSPDALGGCRLGRQPHPIYTSFLTERLA